MFSFKTKIITFIFALIVLFSMFLAYVSGIIKPIIYAKCESVTKLQIEKSVVKALSEKNVESFFKNPIDFIYNEDGSIAAYRADTLSIAHTRAFINEKIISDYSVDSSIDFNISMGTLSGIPFLYEKGPLLSFSINTISFASFNIASEFTDAGINQTLHRIVLNIEAVSTLKAPFSRDKIKVSTDLPLCETVLIGDVPDAYTVIIRAHEEDEEDINDYAAEVEN